MTALDLKVAISVKAEISNQSISIKKGDERVSVEWMSVESVELVPGL
jgi:hypothetical protein